MFVTCSCRNVIRRGGDHSFPQSKDGMLIFDQTKKVVRDVFTSDCVNSTMYLTTKSTHVIHINVLTGTVHLMGALLIEPIGHCVF